VKPVEARTNHVVLRRRLHVLRRVLLGIGKGLAWTVIGLAALLASLWIHLDSGTGRDAICSQSLAIANGIFKGRIEVGRCAEVSLESIELRRVAILDPSGQPVVRAASIVLVPDLPRLLAGTIAARELRIADPWLSLRQVDGELAIARAFEPRVPSPPSTEPSSAPAIAAGRLLVERGRVDDLPEGLSVRDIDVDLRDVFFHDTVVEADIEHARAEARRGRDRARLTRLEGRVSTRDGGESHLLLALSAGESSISADAKMTYDPDRPVLDASTVLDVHPSLLDLASPGTGAALRSPVTGTVAARGTFDELVVDADLHTDGGPLVIEATGRDLLGVPFGDATVSTTGLDLHRVLAAFDTETFVRGAVSVETEAPVAGGRPIKATIRQCAFRRYSLPELVASATLYDDRAELHDLALPHLTEPGGRLDLSATYWFEGRARVDLETHLPDLSRDDTLTMFVPGLRGALTAGVHGEITTSEPLTLDARVNVATENLVAFGARVGSAHVRGTASGALRTPRVDLEIGASRALFGPAKLERADLRLDGGPSRYRARGNGRLEIEAGEDEQPPIDLTLALEAAAREGIYVVDGEIGAAGLWPEPLEVALDAIAIDPEREIRARRIGVSGTGVSMRASGVYRFHGRSSAELRIASLDLRALTRRLGADLQLEGELVGTAGFEGTPERPDLTLDMTVADARIRELSIDSAAVRGTFATSRGVLDADVELDLGENGKLEGHAGATFAARRSLVSSLEAASFDTTMTLDDLRLGAFQSFLPENAPPIAGKLDVEMAVRGTVDQPDVHLVVRADQVLTADIGPLTGTLDATLDASRIVAELELGYEDEPIANADLELPFVLRSFLADPDALALLDRDFRVRAELLRQRLDRLPRPLYVALPLRARATLDARGPIRTLEADAVVSFALADRDLLPNRRCDEPTGMALDAELSVRAGRSTVELRGYVARAKVLTGEVHADTPLETWLGGEMPTAPPPVRAELELENLPLARLPGVCSVATGSIAGSVRATDLFAARPHFEASLHASGLTAGRGTGADVDVSIEAGPSEARVEVTMESEGRRTVDIDGRAAIVWNDEQPVPVIDNGTWDARARFDRAPLGPIAALVPLMAQPRGVVDGRFEARGRGQDFDASGSLSLEHVYFIWTTPLVRIDDLNGRIALGDRGVTIRELTFRDLDGSGRVDGTVGLTSEFLPSRIDLTLETDDLPIRNSGLIVATVDGRFRVRGDLSDEHPNLAVGITRLGVMLPADAARTLQPLDQHADVIYENQPGFLEGTDPEVATEVRVQAEERDNPFLPLRVSIDASEPFWVRREDFAMQVTAQLDLTLAADGVRIEGPIRIRRGYIDLLTKTFELEASELRFVGGRMVDPVLNVTARYDLGSGDSITVHITGRLGEPELAFSTTVPGVETEREVLELLVRGNSTGSTSAEDEVVSALGGLTAGLLSGIARREYGELIPILSIESEGTGGGRIRAGIDADRLIPDFLEDIVTGAYFEGFVGTAADANGSQSATGGFELDLYFPYDLTLSGGYEPPTNWSWDFTWEP
jgi:hypothetical protein